MFMVWLNELVTNCTVELLHQKSHVAQAQSITVSDDHSLCPPAAKRQTFLKKKKKKIFNSEMTYSSVGDRVD